MALQSDNPWELVPTRDLDGHGTFIAGVAAGSMIEEREFSGIAPLASICMVKCKEAKQNLKDYYRIDTDEPCFSEVDLMMALRYLRNKALEISAPLVVCFAMGTSLGGHNRGGFLGEYFQEIGDYRGNSIVVAGGNEANTSHHYHGSNLPPGGVEDVELRIGSGRHGFTLVIWSDAPQLFSVGIVSPDGEYSSKTQPKLNERNTINFLFDETVIDVEYRIAAFEGGDACLQIRFSEPGEGIWKLRIFNENKSYGTFDIWMPIHNFLSTETYFLRPDPDITLCDPANNLQLISTTFYNANDRSVAVDSSRGYSRSGYIRPDIAAPGVNIYGPIPRIGTYYPESKEERDITARYEYRTDSSAAAAVLAGAATLLLEWAFIRGNDYNMDTSTMQKYFIRGADSTGLPSPNRMWGNGTLDLYATFERLTTVER